MRRLRPRWRSGRCGWHRRSWAFIGGLEPDSLRSEGFTGLLAVAGMGGGAGLPERMATVDTPPAAWSPALRERLLVEFLGALYA